MTCLTSPEVESGSLTKIATSADRFAGGVISPLNAVTKAEIQLDRMAKLSPSEFATQRQAVDEAAPKLSGEQAAYAEFIRTRLQSIGESAEDRKDAATRTGKLLRDMRLVGAKQTAWWTIRRDGQAAKMLLQGALQYLTDRRLPTDDDLPVIENKLPSPSQVLRLVDDSEKLTSLPADEQRSFDVLYISAMLRSDSARATEADLQSATTRADRLLSDMPKLQADKQEMLVRRMRGQLALREWDQCKSSAQRDAAIEHYAALIRHFYALSSPKPVQPDPDVEKYCFYHVSEPIVSRLLGSMCRSTPDEWNDLFDDPQVKVDAACLAAAYGRAGQRYPSLVVPALCVHNAFVLATVCDPSRPEYWLGKGRSLLDLPNMTVKELVAELAVVLRDERRAAPADAPPELAELQGLRGTLLIWNARLSNVESDKIRLLTDAMHALGDAQSRASRDEFYCTYLEGLSSVHLELAFLCPPAGCQEIAEPPQDSKRWHLARAVTFAKQAAELPPQSRRLPENAHNAWGNALEDQAWYLRQTECFAESIRQFEAAEKAIGDSPRGVGTCLLHRGRCRLRYAIALPPGSIDDPARLDEPRVLPWNDVLEQLTLAEQDLTSAKNSFAKTELRERAEAHFWLGRVIDEQFRVLDVMSKIMVKPAMSREAANSLIAKAEAEFAAAAQLAKENADDSSWAAYQLELARFVRAAAPVRAATLAREILDAASPPASRKLSRQDVIDTCEFLVAGMPYNRGLKPEDFLAANEKVFAEHRKIVDRADQILSAKDAQSRHAYLDLRARTLVLFNGLASEEKRRGIRPEYEKLRTEAAKYWAEFPNPGRADAEFSWRKLDVALLRHELRQRADPTADEQIAIQLDSLLELRIKSLDPGNLAVLAQLDDPKASTERALIDLRRNSTCLYERFAAHVYETRDIRDEAARNARKVYDREVGRDAEKASRFAAIAYRAWKPLTSSKSIPESEFHLLVKSLGEARPPMKRQ